MGYLISIDLTRDEALVLFEAVAKIGSKADILSGLDEVEQQMIFDLEAKLERKLADIFDANYDVIVAEAKQKLCER